MAVLLLFAGALLLGAPLLACMLLFVLRWYEGCNAHVEDGEPLPSFRLFAFCTVQAWGSLMAMYCLYPGRFFMNSPAFPGPGPDQKPPLLLVHPASHNAASWAMYRYALRKAGYSRLCFFEYSCRNTTFAEVSTRLAAHMDALVAACPGEKPIVMGASLGALLVRSALSGISEATRRNGLGGCITLACPHEGSRLAPLAPVALGEVLCSIAWRGQVVRDMLARENLPAMPCTAFSSALDEMVIPQKALAAPAGWKEIRTLPISHISIMLHLPTIRSVLAELESMAGNACYR